MTIAEDAARWVAWLTASASQFNIGYSQPRRWTFMAAARQGAGTADADCSALVSGAYNLAGILAPFPEDGTTWTGSLRELAADRGFQVIPYGQVGPYPGNLQPGDLLLSERDSGGVGHVAMALWGDSVGEAWIDSQGSDGWDDPDEPIGDQTGGETRQGAYTDHPYTIAGRWTHVLRYTGPNTTTSTTTEELPVQITIGGSNYDAADVIAAIDQRVAATDARTAAIEQTLGVVIAKLSQIADRVGLTGDDVAATRQAAESTASVVSGRGVDLADGSRTDLGAALRDSLNEQAAARAAGI